MGRYKISNDTQRIYEALVLQKNVEDRPALLKKSEGILEETKKLHTAITSLSLTSSSNTPSHAHSNKGSSRPTEVQITDSWEDEEVDSESEGLGTSHHDSSLPNAPPPTPVSPVAQRRGSRSRPLTAWSSPTYKSNMLDQDTAATPSQPRISRQEKSTAAAGRMIAGALGVKVPEKSEEALAYEKAVRDKEARRIRKEKEARVRDEEQMTLAKKQIWED
ncbi:MAG: hypothetical protein Q9167_006510 [Letrouitia subvulpina]